MVVTGNVKDVVDSLNAVEKYLNKSMFWVFHTEKNTEKNMNAHISTPNGATSLSLEAQRILQLNEDMMEFFTEKKNY